MRALSKSRLLAYRQCHRRLWLEVNRPDLREDSGAIASRTGQQVGDVARRLYDPKSSGVVIDLKAGGPDAALAQTAEALKEGRRVFEGALLAGGALIYADVLVPAKRAGKAGWRLVEIKSSTDVKETYQDDIAIQAFVAKEARVKLHSVSVAHIDNAFVYKGDGDYDGLLVEKNLTKETLARRRKVKHWIGEANSVLKGAEPAVRTGRHCNEPYECAFQDYCRGKEPQARHPASILPRVQAKALRALLQENPAIDLADIPDDLLNERQLRIKKHTLSKTAFFDRAGAASDLARHKPPAYFLDFETISFPVPVWKGTRPYQQVPFQFSVHYLRKDGPVEHHDFLDLSGDDPSRSFAEALVERCGSRGPVLVYNATFETARIRELAERFPRLRKALLAINKRVVDLLKVAEERYYHPDQQGSWSIKRLLPTIAPDLRYDQLDGIQDGGMAMEGYLEATAPLTSPTRKLQIEGQLRAYCMLDTYAMVRIWQHFSGRTDLKI